MFNEILIELLENRGVSTYKLTKDTGVSNGLINGWKKGNNLPSAENLMKLADYFDVSVDFLLGRTKYEKFPDQMPAEQESATQPAEEANAPETDAPKEDPGVVMEKEFTVIKINNEILTGENTYLKKKLRKYQKAQQENDLSTLRPRDKAIPLFENDLFRLSFLGCEVRAGFEYLVFYAQNKTNAVLTCQVGALSINGESLGRVFGSEKLLPKSRGQLRFVSKAPLISLDPDKISGEINIVAATGECIPRQRMLVSFVDVDVKSANRTDGK